MPTTTPQLIGADEYAKYYAAYVAMVPPQQNLDEALRVSQHCLDAWLDRLPPGGADYAYAPGKWTVAQAVQHLVDTERVFGYRALWFARGAPDPLPGFDQEAFTKTAPAPRLRDLRNELKYLRATTRSMFSGFDAEALGRRGVASGAEFSVRAQGAIMAGHSYHHAGVFAQKYAGAAG